MSKLLFRDKLDVNEYYIFDTFDNDLFFSFTGEVLIKDYFSNNPKTDLRLLVHSIATEKHHFEIFILPEAYTSINTYFINKFKEIFPNNVISLNQIGSTGMHEAILNNLDLDLSKNHYFAIIASDENNNLQDYAVSTQSISTPSQLEIKQYESALKSINSSKIIEGLTWALLGVSGIVFLAQIGLNKNE